jgi:mannose-6-phosphate isomerase-like protein (cupin superfamily)
MDALWRDPRRYDKRAIWRRKGFGAVTLRVVVAAMLAGVTLALAFVWSTTLRVQAVDSSLSGVTVTTLAQGPVKALPQGQIFVNILEFNQVPGANFGPHSHIPAFVYTVRGTSTITFLTAPPLSVGPGEAAFIPAFTTHTHENVDGRLGAVAIAGGLIVLVILLCAATIMRGRSRRITIAVLSLLAIGGGALPLVGATSNDYYLIAVRPDAQRVLAMPRPDGHVFYSSPDVDPVPAGPYIESLSAIGLGAGSRYEPPVAAGPQMLIVMDGTAAVQVGGQTIQVSAGNGTFAQAGQTLAIANPGSQDLRIIDFTVSPAASAAP